MEKIIIPQEKEIYDDYITRIKLSRDNCKIESQYQELHHIIPRCLGGDDSSDNLIYLYAQEHYYAHKLLALENPQIDSLVYAWWMMAHMNNSNQRHYMITAEEYAEARENFAKSISAFKTGKKQKMTEAIQNGNIKRSTPVKCLETGKIYYGASEAARQTDGNPSNISRCCKGYIKTSGGLHWEYVALELSNKYKDAKQQLQNRKKKHKEQSISVICVETGMVYNSMKEAAILNNGDAARISKCCQGINRTSGGYHWRYADQELADSFQEQIEKKEQSSPCTNKKVFCVELNTFYESLKQAAAFTGANAACISDCCRGKRNISGGYHWKYAYDVE